MSSLAMMSGIHRLQPLPCTENRPYSWRLTPNSFLIMLFICHFAPAGNSLLFCSFILLYRPQSPMYLLNLSP